MAHSVVELAMAMLGHGTPTHLAWQQMSLEAQPVMQEAVGERGAVEVDEPLFTDAEVALELEPAWGMAEAAAAKPRTARRLKNFMLRASGSVYD